MKIGSFLDTYVYNHLQAPSWSSCWRNCAASTFRSIPTKSKSIWTKNISSGMSRLLSCPSTTHTTVLWLVDCPTRWYLHFCFGHLYFTNHKYNIILCHPQVCASLLAIDLLAILNCQLRGWFSAAMVGLDQADFFIQTEPGSKKDVWEHQRVHQHRRLHCA